MRLGYVRVSTIEQNESRQLETMDKHQVEKIFSEKISGKSMERPKLKELLEFAREGDVVVIHSFDRLARNTQDLLQIVEHLNSRGIQLISAHENIDTNTPTGKLLLTVIAAIAQFERENIRERQLEGIALAKQRGVYKGRHPINPDNFDTYYNMYMKREITKTEFAKRLHISRQTLYKLLKNKTQTQ